MKHLLAASLLLAAATFCMAQAEDFLRNLPAPHSTHALQPIDPTPHPLVPAEDQWARPMILVIVGLFIAAIPIGVIVRANMPDPLPVSHDEHDHAHQDAHGGHGGHGKH